MARQRGNRWQADVLIDGQRKRVSFATEVEAVAYEKAVELGHTGAPAVTLGPFIDEYFELLWGGDKRPESSRLSCKVIMQYIPETTPMANITTKMIITDLIGGMKKAGKAGGTINRKLSALSKIMKLAKRLEVVDRLPEFDYQQEGKGRELILDKPDEVKGLLYLDHLGLAASAALMRFLLYTGCRLGEAYKVSRKNVANGYVTFVDTKNGDNRSVLLIGPAKEGWEAICKMTDADIPFAEALPVKTFRGHWERLRVHLEIADDGQFVPHMLRHTCCSRLVIKGVPLPQVMKWMGHRNIQTTMRYAHLAPKDLDMAARALLAA
ncbi:site-specific integrase [Aminobacter anthyllidis]|uniref:Site-specific integrase n=1 Tax=Aminobacter anthyllidis TaxID=1035067 RepID=A0A9X1A6T9_9HYPH|nr:site-specific integrase [Aminobacter anthyllidis]MBT1154401.1 site-specific integrase [Aminobacter anthyllidis]